MPIPTPESGESPEEFISRCMVDQTMVTEYPQGDQRAAVCHAQLEVRAFEAVEANVIETYETGGGLIEIPIMQETAEIDLSRTAGGGDGTASITADDLREMVENSKRWAGPVPVGVSPHREFSERAGASPGFIESLAIRGKRLFAKISLVPELFREVVEGYWRGFSAELWNNAALPTVKLKGWAIHGGVFTNRPATDVNYKISFGAVATKGSDCAVVHLSLRPSSRGDREEEMSEEKQQKDEQAKTVSLEYHEAETQKIKAEVETKDRTIASLESRLERRGVELTDARKQLAEAESTAHSAIEDKASADGKANRLEVEAKRLREEKRSLETALNEANDRLKAEAKQNLSMKVEDTITEAIDAGVPPSIFLGHEDDPAAWMESNYASFEAFKSSTEKLHGLSIKPGGKAQPSGREDAEGDRAEHPGGIKLSAEEKAAMAKRGINPDFAGITDEKEARRIFEAKQAANKE